MFSDHYEDWRLTRLNTVKKYVEPGYFQGKTLLELGCGHGDIGHAFHELGAIVTSSDGRAEHLEVVQKKYPHLKTLCIDGDRVDLQDEYDVVVHWGLLYHLREIEEHLEKVSQKCRDLLLLETEVCDSDDPDFFITTNEEGYDQALNKKGIRPSPSYVEKILEKNGFRWTLVKDPGLNSGFHCYDWTTTNSKQFRDGLRRFWICYNVKSILSG